MIIMEKEEEEKILRNINQNYFKEFFKWIHIFYKKTIICKYSIIHGKYQINTKNFQKIFINTNKTMPIDTEQISK